MIARFLIRLPFAFSSVSGLELEPLEIERGDYKIRIFPPLGSPSATRHSDAVIEKINGEEAFSADVLQVDFFAPTFDRKKDQSEQNEEFETDPSLSLVSDVANEFLMRMRFVCNAPQVKSISLLPPTETSFKLSYLEDDESELPIKDGYFRTRWGLAKRITTVTVTKEVWEDLVNNSEITPSWMSLMLDAMSLHREPVAAIVLAHSALEVFISQTLDALADENELPTDLWNWINDRGFFLKNPSLSERLDFLFSFFTGRSIKNEEPELWELYKELNRRRNKLAHEGEAEADGLSVTDVIRLLQGTYKIIYFVNDSLPETLRFKVFKRDIKLQTKLQLN